MGGKVYDILKLGRAFYRIGLSFNHIKLQMSSGLKVNLQCNKCTIKGDSREYHEDISRYK